MDTQRCWKGLALAGAVCLIAGGSEVRAATPDWLALIGGAFNAQSQAARPAFTDKLLTRAVPDECFNGVGQPYPPIDPTHHTCSTGQPKTNEAYVWGLVQAQSTKKLWFGTAANVLCLVNAGYFGADTPTLNKSWVCEYDQSQLTVAHPSLGNLGDWRPPSAYEYDPVSHTLTPRTPAALDPKNLGLFQTTLGIRSAGSLDGIVFLAGPGLAGGVNFFAFNAANGSLVGACAASAFSDIRDWVELKGTIYAGIGATAGGGGVIAWTGTPDAPFTNTATCGFNVITTGFPGDAAYVTTVAKTMLAVSAWPSSLQNPQGAGIYLVNPTSGAFQRLWQPSDYEPDTITGLTYGGGAIVEWKKALYFMTLHVPGLAAGAHSSCSDPICFGTPATPAASLELFYGTSRATSVWRINNPTTSPTVQLLYGESQLPAYDPVSKQFTPHATGFTPRFGHSGFGNAFNNYGWTATVANGKLLLGTMDYSYLIAVSLNQAIPGLPLAYPGLNTAFSQAAEHYGADLWRFDQPDRAAIAESVNGLGNTLNYGIRTLITAADGKTAYAGTANPMNLETKGGWELRSLKSGGH